MVGWVPITGADVAAFTVSVAALLVAVETEFVATQRNVSVLMPMAVTTVRLVVVEPP